VETRLNFWFRSLDFIPCPAIVILEISPPSPPYPHIPPSLPPHLLISSLPLSYRSHAILDIYVYILYIARETNSLLHPAQTRAIHHSRWDVRPITDFRLVRTLRRIPRHPRRSWHGRGHCYMRGIEIIGGGLFGWGTGVKCLVCIRMYYTTLLSFMFVGEWGVVSGPLTARNGVNERRSVRK
jgi:hypothetical protein